MNITKPQKMIYNMVKVDGDSVATNCSSLLIDGEKSISDIQAAVNGLFYHNDILRVKFFENNGALEQEFSEFSYRNFEVLRFADKEELDAYAENYVKKPLVYTESVCDFKIVILNGKYGLLVKLHHIISDAWTFGLIFTQFDKLLNKTEIEVGSYSDYVESERNYLNSNKYEKDKNYFLNQIKKCNTPVFLSDNAVASLDAHRRIFVIEKNMAEKIRAFAKEKECSVFSLFSLALAIYISKVKANAERLFVGTTILNRNNSKELNTAGIFINSVPMLFELDESKTFEENLELTEDSLMSLFRHQKFSYSDLLLHLRSENNAAKTLYDVMINYMNAVVDVTDKDIQSSWYYNGRQYESLVLNIDDRDQKSVFKMHYDYQIEKFNEQDIEKIHNHLCNLFSDAIENPSKKITELEMLSAEEKQKVLYDFNNTAVSFPKDKCIHELFEEQAKKTPDKVAVVATDKTLTYRELNEEANRIAHSLIEKGIGKGDIVGLMLPRKSYLLSALFGILKTGAAYLPIDSELPLERIKYMCKDTEAVLVISDKNIYSLLESGDISNPCTKMTNDSVCYCIYTSGSTGQPKGVMAMHRNVVNYISKNEHNIAGKIIADGFETIVSISTCSFDIFVTETVLPLVNGLRTVLADEEQCRNQYALNKLLSKEKGEFLQTTPTKFKALTAEPSQREFLKNVKAVLLGGEAMEASHLQEFKKITNAKIYNIYGATEVPIWSTFADTDTFTDAITIGKPIANTQIYILDKHLKPVPIGVMGELCIAGASVSAGYLNRPEQTAEKFIDNPFGEGRLYRTGDNAYWREDGNIVYVGRSDFQVKIRGLRIELGEIESALQSVAGIDRAVVVVRKDKEDRQLICAFYTGQEKSAKELRKEIGKSLPKYMIPHIFTCLEKMPMTASGKANRNALPEIDLENISTETEYVVPETAEEKILAECVEDVLGTERVSVLDNFFDIGGDSLKAIALTARLEEKGYTIAIKTIFSCKDIKELAENLEAKEQEEKKIEYGRVIPATSAQMRVYTAQIMKPDSTMYNITYAFKTDNVDKAQLEKAVNELIERHESLRIHFENREGQIVQVIDEKAELSVESITDINSFSKPFDLSVSPLLCVGCTEDTVVIDMHHIVTDGESMPVFFSELNELYMGRDLPETVQYGEFAVTDGYTEENEKYWLDVFKGEIPTLELPADYPRGGVQSFEGSNIYERIDIKLHEKIEEKCKEKGITPYVFYMTCFNILLSKYSGNEDIVVGTPVSGRSNRFLESVGMFVNTVALRSRPEGQKTVGNLLAEIRDSSIEAIDNQNYPFGELVKKLNIEVGGRNPLYDVMLAYQSFEMTDISFLDKKVELIPLTAASSKCDITLTILPRKDDVVLAIEYCTDLFKEDKILEFAQMYIHLLEVCLDEDKCIRDVSVIDMSRIDEFNDTAHVYSVPVNSTLYSLFEKTAKENKDKICIRTAEKDISFGELKNISENLDSEIRKLTKGKKSVIAVIAERSVEMYSAIYGIIRGGNAYLPIDPEYPQERIDYILSNSEAAVVIAQSKFTDLAGKTSCIDMTELLKNSVEKQSNIPDCDAEPEDTAYVIYTSGSTGTPKGAKVSHRSAVNRILWMHDKYPLCKEDVILQKTPYTFDVSVWEHFWWGLCGGSLAVSNPGEHFLPAKILDETRKNKVTHIHFVPSVFDLFLNYLENHKEECYKFSSVKHVFLSGEALAASLIQRFYSLFDYNNATLHNLYGPTECAVDVTYYDCTPNDVDPVPIGKPIYNTQMYIVDKYMNPVLAGVTGELCIAGMNVGQGYINNSELTAEKFIDNPFGEGRLYRTGDLAYRRKDGQIVFSGRKDSQIKLNGQRVETGEIESVISALTDVEASVVLVRKINQRDVLVAFYCGKKDLEIKIKDVCRARLPKYMVPSMVLHIDEMPLNQSGKLDRKALAETEINVYKSETEGPANDTERYICKVFEDILGEKNISKNSDFFEMSGTSYSMISLLSEKGFEDITSAEFMRNSTPALLAALMNEKSLKKTSEYIEALYIPEKPEKTLILLPFAGGGAEAYSNLVLSIKKANKNIAVYFIRYLHSIQECKNAATEIAYFFKNTDVSFYSHCVGSALALNIILYLERNNISVKHYCAAASIPPAKPTKNNIWNKVSDRLLRTILSRAGAKLDNLSDEKLVQLLGKFRKDTDFANISYFEFNGKIKTPVTVILSKKDIFTLNYRQAEKLWKMYVSNVTDVHYINSKSHYFQTNNSACLAEFLLKMI